MNNKYTENEIQKIMDFIIEEDNFETIVFRLYPDKCHVHGFEDTPPTKWENVYKVYYLFDIIQIDGYGTRVLYKEDFDECSVLNEVSYCIGKIINNKNKKDKYYLKPFSNATSYEIEKLDTWRDEEYWQFTMFNREGYQGFRFILDKDKLKSFKEYLDTFLEYSLKHSEGI